jgi:hypothetical protein
MRTIKLALILLVAFGASLPSIFAADGRATISAILVIASNEAGRSDPKLAPYEANLKRTLRYESFRFVDERSATVATGGKATLNLPSNNRLELEADGNGRVKVSSGSTSVAIPPGQTVVLAGRSAGNKGEIFAVIVSSN